MKKSDKALVVGGALAAVAIATLLIFFSLNEELLQFVLDIVYGGTASRMVVVSLSLVVIIVAIKIILDITQRVNPYMAAIVSSNGAGKIHVNISALERTALQLAQKSAQIEDTRVFIESHTKGLKVILEIETPSGQNIQKVATELQGRVKDVFEKQIGVKVMEVQVLVKSLGVIGAESINELV